MSEAAKTVEAVITNGINVTEFEETVEAVKEDPSLAEFRFRATNRWDDGGYNVTTIRGFYGAGEEQGLTDRVFRVGADEPPVLLGDDRAPNPVEYLLHALAGCLTSTLVYKAASKGIEIRAIDSTLEGDLDALRFLELSDAGRAGYRNIRATFSVSSDASAEELRELAEFSPVLDVLRNGTEIDLDVVRA